MNTVVIVVVLLEEVGEVLETIAEDVELEVDVVGTVDGAFVVVVGVGTVEQLEIEMSFIDTAAQAAKPARNPC